MAVNKSGKLIVNLAGDVMIGENFSYLNISKTFRLIKGRLIDQLLPTSVHNPEEAAIVRQFRSSRSSRCPYLAEGKYNYSTVWGDTLPLWKEVRDFDQIFQESDVYVF